MNSISSEKVSIKDTCGIGIKTGKWLPSKRRGIVTYSIAYRDCSVCDKPIYLAKSMKYCPNCGAKMEVEE